MEKCDILGVKINITDMSEVVKVIEENLHQVKGQYVCLSNVHTTVTSYEHPQYKKIQNEAFMALPDGKPLSVIQRMRGFKQAKKISGHDLMEEIFKISEEKGYTHYFFGSTEDVLDCFKRRVLERYPQLKIVGMYSPPFKPITVEEDEVMTRNINEAAPDFLWVGMGAPKQEIWMHLHKNRVNSLMFGVGAAFNFLSGKVKRAPQWVQDLCLEWLYRLIMEPRRLFKRYAVTNSKFLFYMVKNKFSKG